MRLSWRIRTTLTVFAVALIASGAVAQVTTGRIIGTIEDQNAGALPGVTVTVNAEALLGGAKSSVTDVNGGFSFIGLPVGVYTIQAALPGFVTQERNEVKVPLGGAASVIITMPDGGTFEDEIQVVAETPVVDPTQVTMEQTFDAVYLQNAAIGANNRSYQNMLYQAAGADSSTESAGNPSVFGSTSGENTFYIDGMDTTDPITSTFSANFNFDAIQEVQFQTAGFEAEYGRTIGGVVNLVTKSGGNQFSGTFDVRYRDSSFYTSGDHYDAGATDDQFMDVSATLGGPILRDKVWFFAAYEYVKNDQTPSFSPNTYGFEGNYPFAKLSWQADQNWRAVAKYSGDPVTINNPNATDTRYIDPDTMATRDQGGFIANAELNGVLSDSLMWNAIVGIKRSELNQNPKLGPDVISHWSYYTGLFTQNYDRQELSKRDRDEFSTDLTWFVGDFGGSHEIKGGFEYGRFMENASTICNSGPSSGEYGCTGGGTGGVFYDNTRYEDFNHPYYWYQTDSVPPQDFQGDMYSAFIQDSWRPTPNLTLKLGVRWDDITWKDNDNVERIWFDKLQPRVGFAWDITGDAKNVLRGNFGRFMHPANTSVPSFLSTSASGTYYYASCSYGMYRQGVGDLYLSADECQAIAEDLGWDYITDPEGWDPAGWAGPFFSAAAGAATEVDPNLKPTYADEWAISFERAVAARSSIEISYVNKATRDILEDTCRGNFYDGPSEDADCGNFLIFNYPERDYQGLTVKYETRTYSWMTLMASYTYSKAEGSADTRHYFFGDYDFYPWDFMNMYGYTMMHRPHRLKFNGFFNIKGDWTVGFDATWFDKFRYNTLDDEFPEAPPGTTVFAEPRGTREGNTNYNVDLQLSKGFNVAGMRMVLIGSVLNVTSVERPLNATDVCEQTHGCADPESDGLVGLGDAIDWSNPRRFEVGFRLEF